MLKTPISILQELVVKKKLQIPDYEITGSGEPHAMSFVCTVTVGKDTATGSGLTKKDAKQKAAKNFLETLGINMDDTSEMASFRLLPTKSRREFPSINYVGRLNEFASGRKLPQPEYDTESLPISDGQFCVICVFMEFQSEGYGANKKDAKQDAARKILNLMKDSDMELLNWKESIVANPQEESKDVVDDVLKKYSEIIKNVCVNAEQLSLKDTLSPSKAVSLRTWEELTNHLTDLGWNYELSDFQANPLILTMKIKEKIFLETGSSREEIKKKLTDRIVPMLVDGVSFDEL